MAGTIEIKVPRLAESISEAVLVQWLQPDGATVRLDQPVATLETDKAAVEIAAEAPGVLRHARAVGETVLVGDVVARTEPSGAEAEVPVASPAAAASPAPPVAPAPAPAVGAGSPAYPSSPRGAPRDGDDTPLSPSVRKMVDEHRLDPAQIPPSGRGGRLLKEDVERYLEGRAAAAPKPAAVPLPAPAAPPPSLRPAAPPAGAAPLVPAPPSAPVLKPGAAPGSDWSEGELERAVPMSRVRARIAERLVEAQRTAAILTTFNEVDMSAVLDLRARYKESFEKRHGVKLSFMSFFSRACVLALEQIPEVNAEVRGTDVVYKRRVHLGIAVGTPRGLVVPIVRDADQRTFADLEREIARLALMARDNKLGPQDLAGGTFTISNGGVYGSLLSTPILNPPQSGILGMHKIEKRPVVVDDAIVIRPMMYLALSYDHRIVDGEGAVTFLVSVKERLEDPERMLLDM